MSTSMRNQKGFTLIELLIVIAIIGLLATLAIVSLTSAQQRARDTKRTSDIKSMQTALELYYSDNATYPVISSGGVDTWAELQTVMSSYVNGVLPVDPNHDNGDEYIYITNSTDQYTLATTVEDADLSALDQDIDTASVGGTDWFKVTSTGDSNDLTDATLDCTDPVYCLLGNASN